MRDLSSYLAGRTLRHIYDQVGRSTFADGAFTRTSRESPSFQAWNGYVVNFSDERNCIRVSIESDGRKTITLEERARVIEKVREEVGVPKKYSEVIEGFDIAPDVSKGGVSVSLHLRHKENSSGRVQNEDKLFYAVYNVAVKPLLRAVSS